VAATVPAGSRTITLQEPVQWRANEHILLVTTTWKGECFALQVGEGFLQLLHYLQVPHQQHSAAVEAGGKAAAQP